ncbi:MAG: hypothetical protein ABEJ35_06460 [Halobacteriaceae archaeon]
MGAVLLFGILIISLAIYQAQVVPNQNREIEAKHHATVKDSMVTVRNALLASAATGDGRPTAVPLGTAYPSRVFAINPPPPSGRLGTAALGPITVENAQATNGEIADYLNGSALNVSTAALIYRPDYNELQSPPAIIYENSLVYTALPQSGRFVEALTDQNLIQGSTISIVALQGNFSESGVRSVTVDPTVLSGKYTPVQVTNATGGPVILTLPTRIPVERWRALIESPRVLSIQSARGGGAGRIELAPGTYTLRMALIGVGTGATDPEPAYVFPVGSNASTIGEGTTTTITFEVRDTLNNPIANASVRLPANASVPGTLRTADGTVVTAGTVLQTDENGRVTLVYKAPEIDGGARNVTIGANLTDSPKLPGDPEYAAVTVTVQNSDRSGLDGGGNGNAINPSTGIVYEGAVTYNDSRITIELRNADPNNTRSIAEARFAFFAADSQGGASATVPDTLQFGDGGPFLTRNGEFEFVGLSFAPSETKTLNISFIRNNNKWEKLGSGDYFVISVIYGDGSTANYFISAAGATSEQQNNKGGSNAAAVSSPRWSARRPADPSSIVELGIDTP